MFKGKPVIYSGRPAKVKSRGHYPDTIVIEFEDGTETEVYIKEVSPA